MNNGDRIAQAICYWTRPAWQAVGVPARQLDQVVRRVEARGGQWAAAREGDEFRLLTHGARPAVPCHEVAPYTANRILETLLAQPCCRLCRRWGALVNLENRSAPSAAGPGADRRGGGRGYVRCG
jgi:hypothetical protein